MERLASFTLFPVVVVLFFGCNPNKESETVRWAGLEHRLTAESLYPEIEILDTWYIVFTENHLIIEQHSEGREYSVFHLKGDSLLYDGAFLSYGRGPLEVFGGYVHYIPQQNSVVVTGYNPVGRSIVIPMDDISNLFTHKNWHVREYGDVVPEIAFFTRAIDTTSYIMPIHNDEERMLAIIDTSKTPELIPLDVEYPDKVRGVDLYEKLMRAHGGVMPQSRPRHKEQFAYSLARGHYVAICTLDDDMQVVDRKIVFDDPAEIHVANGKPRVTGDTKEGLSMSVSENYIYLKDEDITIADRMSAEVRQKRGYPAGYGKTIYVCDWEGKPVAKYELDKAVIRCSIDNKDEYLYAFAFDPESLESDLVRFKLPDLID